MRDAAFSALAAIAKVLILYCAFVLCNSNLFALSSVVP